MSDLFTPIQIAALVVATIGAITDVRTTKIPNILTFPAAAAGLIWNIATGGSQCGLYHFGQVEPAFWWGGLLSLAGWLIGAIIMIFPHRGKIHMGDAKLVAAMGAFLGPVLVLLVVGYFSVIYGIVGLSRFLWVFPWSKMSGLVATAMAGGDPKLEEADALRLNKTMKSFIPLGPAVAVGTLLAILLEKPTLHFMGLQ